MDGFETNTPNLLITNGVPILCYSEFFSYDDDF